MSRLRAGSRCPGAALGARVACSAAAAATLILIALVFAPRGARAATSVRVTYDGENYGEGRM